LCGAGEAVNAIVTKRRKKRRIVAIRSHSYLVVGAFGRCEAEFGLGTGDSWPKPARRLRSDPGFNRF